MGDGLDELQLREQDGALCFEVRVAARAARSAITGVQAGALKLSLTAAPVDGAANAALIELLSDTLSLPKRAVRIAAGAHSRHKRVCVEGVAAAELRAALLAACR
jgi:uncharacterized protein (TIGR00251 family)